MLIRAHVRNRRDRHEVILDTAGVDHSLSIPPRVSGYGSSANGGELLCLAMATCYCNDIYREAQPLRVDVVSVEVSAAAEFGSPGEPATKLSYEVTVHARASEDAIRRLIARTDEVAEIHNTLRLGLPVVLASAHAVSVADEESAGSAAR
ncbi:MAG TPA: OsmC family protein [Casimicrobiaceae bacterium]|nr:OsmC family protein [Casimicrobiaceae bacterium]